MHISRSESRQSEKLKRKKKVRRILAINLVLCGCIILILGTMLALSNDGAIKDTLSNIKDKLKLGPQTAMLDDGRGEEDLSTAGDSEQSEGTVIDDAAQAEGEEPDVSAPDTALEKPGGEADPGSGSEQEVEKISLSFVGDLLLGNYVQPFVLKHGEDYLYEQVLFYLSEPDWTAGNLELPITERGVPEARTPASGYVYKGSPDSLPALRNAGVDIVSLANNHALDQGVEGLEDTMKHLTDAGIAYMGAGLNDKEAFKPVIKEAKGIKVAYIGISNVIPFVDWKADRSVAGVAETYETTRAVAAIAEAKEQADIVVVMVHWGQMGTTELKNYQKEKGRIYIDAGADLVIGSHPHVIQGFEQYNGKWIAYSLGNFIFSSYPKGAEADTGVLDAVCDKTGDCDLKFNPMRVVNAQPVPLVGEEARNLLDHITSISFGVRLEPDGTLAAE